MRTFRTFSTQTAALACAAEAARRSGRKPIVRREQCYGTRKPWTVREATP